MQYIDLHSERFRNCAKDQNVQSFLQIFSKNLLLKKFNTTQVFFVFLSISTITMIERTMNYNYLKFYSINNKFKNNSQQNSITRQSLKFFPLNKLWTFTIRSFNDDSLNSSILPSRRKRRNFVHERQSRGSATIGQIVFGRDRRADSLALSFAACSRFKIMIYTGGDLHGESPWKISRWKAVLLICTDR